MRSHTLLGTIVLTLSFAALHAPAAKVVLVAGGGAGGSGVLATEAALTTPFGVSFDSAGNLYAVEMTGFRVLKIDPKGMLTVIAGSGKKGFAGDGGPAAKAEFDGMHSLAVHPKTNDIYICDTWNDRIRKIDAKTGNISTIAGTGKKGFSGDGGPADKADFGDIYCCAFDPKGERLYLADLDNNRVRVIDMASGIVTTAAGNGQNGTPKDGDDAVKSPIGPVRAVVADGEGNVYLLHRKKGGPLQVVDKAGKIRTLLSAEKAAPAEMLNGPKHLCIDLEGNVIIADTDNHKIRKYIVKEGKVVDLAGTGKKGTAGVGGAPDKVELNQPHGVYVHSSGVLYISDSNNGRILRIEP